MAVANTHDWLVGSRFVAAAVVVAVVVAAAAAAVVVAVVVAAAAAAVVVVLARAGRCALYTLGQIRRRRSQGVEWQRR